MAIHRIPFLCIDSRWSAKWKWLWDDFAGPNETYTGYIDAWDSIPWQRILFDDGVERDFNFAAQAQYIPKYAGEILGTVEDLARILNDDGILYDEILAQYSPESPAGLVNLKRILYKDFDTHSPVCSAVYSRPMSYKFGGSGHIGDNAQQMFFVRAGECCDGTEGLRVSLAPATWKPELRADAIHFARTVKPDEIPEVPEGARLVVYTIAAGSVPRIKINSIWHNVSPIYNPPYGNPYGFVWRGHKHFVANVEDLDLTYEGENTTIVEHIAPRPENIGAQCIFVFEWGDEPEPSPEIKPTRRRKMAEKQGIPTTPIEHLALLELCNMKDDDPGNPAEYKFLAPEKTALTDALTLVTTKFAEWHTRSDELGELTAQWEPLEKQAKDLIGRARNLWSMRFEEGNVYERTAGIDDTPRKKERISKALDRIVMVSNDNAGTLAELPPALLTALQDLYTQTHDNLRKTELARGEKTDSYQELKKAILEHGAPALRACRKYLYAVLPDGRNDELLIEWGFEPFDMPVHHKPVDQKLVETAYDKTTDIVKIRLLEDILASEYIIEFGKTQSPAPQDWKPASWEVFATGDEPFFELGPLVEGNTYAFRGRARNSAGYGGYSEIWIVEVV